MKNRDIVDVGTDTAVFAFMPKEANTDVLKNWRVCPKCGSTLCLCETKMQIIPISPRGIPIPNMAKDFEDSFLKCSGCKEVFNYTKHGMFYIPVEINPVADFPKLLKKALAPLLHPENNPFYVMAGEKGLKG